METSYNGWPASPDPAAIGLEAGFEFDFVTFPGGVKSGPVAYVFADLLDQYVMTVEPLTAGWCWGYNYRPNVNDPSVLSCHSSGTAIDVNAPAHPNGVAGTVPNVERWRRLLAERYGGLVTWGGDFSGTPDEMHYEISGTPDEISDLADRLADSYGPPPWQEGDDMPLSDDDVQKVAAATLEGIRALIVTGNVYDDGVEERRDEPLLDALATLKTSTARTQKKVGAGS